MKQIAQNYKSGQLSLLDVPVPTCRPGGVLVRTTFSVISAGTELMKISESKLSLIGKARARPDQVKKVIDAVRQQGVLATFQKVMNRLDSYTPLGYSLSGVVVEVGAGVEGLRVGQRVACAGNQYALHAEYNWVPEPMCIPIPDGVAMDQAAFTTIAAIALQGLRQGEVRLGETACVIGLGLLGQILVRLLRGAGVRVVGIDIVPERCRLAETAGASKCAAPGTPEFDGFQREVANLTGGHGVDCIFITAGGDSNDPVEMAAELARDRAREASNAGVVNQEIDRWKAELATIDEKLKAAHESNTKQARHLDGLMKRIQISHEIGGWVPVFILLLLLAIETGPIFFKMMLRRGAYDQLQENEARIAAARAGIEIDAQIYAEGTREEVRVDVYHHAEAAMSQVREQIASDRS